MSKSKQIPMPQPPALSQDEIAAVEARRKHDAALKACSEEIAAVLAKHGFVLDVQMARPQIVLVPAPQRTEQ